MLLIPRNGGRRDQGLILLCLLVDCIGLGAQRAVLQPQRGWFRDTLWGQERRPAGRRGAAPKALAGMLYLT